MHYLKNNLRILMCVLPGLLLLTPAVIAQTLPERSLALDARISDSGSHIDLSWAQAKARRVQRTRIERRRLGETGKYSWQFLGTVRQIARLYSDEDIRAGIGYEYRISRPSEKMIESGYWAAGLRLPAQEQRGIALLVIDETIAEALTAYLDRFVLDLIGDGWTVIRQQVPRGDHQDPFANLGNARQIQGWIRQQYAVAPETPHALILVGGVPVVESGKSAPDGHEPRALETDLFYADVDGDWRDNGNQLLHDAIPGDHIEMQVGRIDFSHLSEPFDDEISLLKRYFDKNHHWRHGLLGDLRGAYGGSDHLFVERNALRNIVGPDQISTGNHHETGRQQPWLLGLDFGSHKYEDYAGQDPVRSVFTLNFGSGKLDFSGSGNTMRALLAQDWYTLTTGWGARPAWQLHHVAMGKSIGYSHLRTVNNGTHSKGGNITLEYTSTGNYPWVNPVWVNLLGDPTLHAFPLLPVRHLRARKVSSGVQLEWDTSQGSEQQFRIYRASKRFGEYRPLNPQSLLDGNRYLDTAPEPGAWYMVRAHGLQEVYAGSFYLYSQGRFATVKNRPPQARDQALTAFTDKPLDIRLSASDADGDKLILAPVTGPEGGYLQSAGEDWRFVAKPGFTGKSMIPFSIFDGVTSDEGSVTIEVKAP